MKKVIIFISIITSIFILNNKVYAYQSYKIGDKVTYNEIDFYVIKDSSSDSDYVTLLKAEPLTVDEVEKYGVGHVNMYVKPYSGYETFLESHASDQNGYGGMAYYASETCYLYNKSNCKNDYLSSEIKYVVDGWASDKIPTGLQEVRLITMKEYISLNDEETYETPTEPGTRYVPHYNWLFNENYWYWTENSYEDYNNYNLIVDRSGFITYSYTYDKEGVVRPVVELYKCAIDDTCGNNDIEYSDDSNETDKPIINNNETKEEVSVPNTLKSVSGLIILIGMVLVCVGLNIFIIVKNKRNK